MPRQAIPAAMAECCRRQMPGRGTPGEKEGVAPDGQRRAAGVGKEMERSAKLLRGSGVADAAAAVSGAANCILFACTLQRQQDGSPPQMVAAVGEGLVLLLFYGLIALAGAACLLFLAAALCSFVLHVGAQGSARRLRRLFVFCACLLAAAALCAVGMATLRAALHREVWLLLTGLLFFAAAAASLACKRAALARV